MTGNLASHGRGGAGNISDKTASPRLQPADLETPTLKGSVVTTGRGGSGNMKKNDDPVETRARQDVGPVTERRPSGTQHVGRGGAGNLIRASSKERAANESAVADDVADASQPPKKQSLGDKVKEVFSGKKNGDKA